MDDLPASVDLPPGPTAGADAARRIRGGDGDARSGAATVVGTDLASRPPTIATPTASTPRGSGGVPRHKTTFRLGNRPALTGIRAFGIASVLVYHSNFKTFPGAWQALGMFFTLSGFLITSMLLGEHERTSRVSLKRFYSRRALRLLPPLVLTVGLLAIYALIHPVGEETQRVWGDSLATLFYFADYRSALGHEPFFGFFAQAWSLSVEEQFYVVWSVFLVAALWTRRRRVVAALAVVGFAASFADRTWLVLRAHPFTEHVFARTYYAFDTRADAIFLGCLLGVVATGGHLDGWGRPARHALVVAAVASAAVLVWIGFEVPLGSRAMVLWWLPTTEVLWAVVLVYFVVVPEGIGTRFVGLGLFVWLGDMSYTLYLVHWPVFVAWFPAPGHFWSTEALRLGVTFGVAVVSWYAMERPLMRWRRRALS